MPGFAEDRPGSPWTLQPSAGRKRSCAAGGERFCYDARRAPRVRRIRDTPLATEHELATFLAEVERRAFKQAVFAVRNDQVALDLVQDAMLRLAEKYAARPAAELPLLFQRILQNVIRDHYRRSRVRSLWTTLLSSLQGSEDDDERDPLDRLQTDAGANRLGGPAEQTERSQVLRLIEAGLESLPPRQREAFLLRYWEEFDVAETAQAMGCSEGSVKTHCSRATHSLAIFLKSRGVEL